MLCILFRTLKNKIHIAGTSLPSLSTSMTLQSPNVRACVRAYVRSYVRSYLRTYVAKCCLRMIYGDNGTEENVFNGQVNATG